MMPKGTEAPEGAEAVDTAFEACDGDDCQLADDFENVDLQRLNVTIPAGAGLTGHPRDARFKKSLAGPSLSDLLPDASCSRV